MEKRKIVMKGREQDMRCRNKLCVYVNTSGWRAVRLLEAFGFSLRHDDHTV